MRGDNFFAGVFGNTGADARSRLRVSTVFAPLVPFVRSFVHSRTYDEISRFQRDTTYDMDSDKNQKQKRTRNVKFVCEENNNHSRRTEETLGAG